MRGTWIGTLACTLVLGLPLPPAQALGFRQTYHLAGTLVDYTANRGADRRMWSAALGAPRDLYVYLPPGYDPSRRYPLMIWLHGIAEDEDSFPADGLRYFDAAMAAGRLPPMIIALPDGTADGRNHPGAPRPMFLNSNIGAYEDYAAHDVFDFVQEHYPILPERQAHFIGGFSGGGAAAYRIAIKHRDRFAVVFAGSPPLNVRWLNCHGRYFANFDPDCWGWRTDIRGHEVVGRFVGVVTFRLGRLVYPLYGKGPQAIEAMARENPIELLETEDVRPGELSMLVAYGGKDQFNIDAQVESFVYRVHERGMDITICYAPFGRHNLRHPHRFFPEIVEWLAPQVPASAGH
jgi:S-formylglutathione hydrolase FrmB